MTTEVNLFVKAHPTVDVLWRSYQGAVCQACRARGGRCSLRCNGQQQRRMGSKHLAAHYRAW
jgi:hypothetical protein